MLAYFTHVLVSTAAARRRTEQAGAAYVVVQTAQVEELERTLPAPPQGPAVQLLSVDGAMVPLVQGEWAEVKTLALGHVQEPVVNKRGEQEVHTTALSYFSRLADHETFGRLATVETHQRGSQTAGGALGAGESRSRASRGIAPVPAPAGCPPATRRAGAALWAP